MALFEVTKAGAGGSVDLTAFETITLPVTNAKSYKLIMLVGTGSTGGAISSVTINCDDPATNKYTSPTEAHGTAGSTVMIYEPTIDAPTITASATSTQPSTYPANGYVSAYGIPK